MSLVNKETAGVPVEQFFEGWNLKCDVKMLYTTDVDLYAIIWQHTIELHKVLTNYTPFSTASFFYIFFAETATLVTSHI